MKNCLALLICMASFQAAEAVTYPQLALGGGFDAIVILTNKTTVPWEGTAYLRRGAHEAWSTPWTINGIDATGFIGFSINLGPRETWKATLKGDATPRAGYLVIEGDELSSTEDIVSSYFFNWNSQDGTLIDSTGVSPSEGAFRFMFSVEKDIKIDTGFALAPDVQTGPFSITATLYDSAGDVHDQQILTFSGHTAHFVSGFFDNVPNGFVGMVHLESPSRVFLAVLRQQVTSTTDFQLTSVLPDTSVP